MKSSRLLVLCATIVAMACAMPAIAQDAELGAGGDAVPPPSEPEASTQLASLDTPAAAAPDAAPSPDAPAATPPEAPSVSDAVGASAPAGSSPAGESAAEPERGYLGRFWDWLTTPSPPRERGPTTPELVDAGFEPEHCDAGMVRGRAGEGMCWFPDPAEELAGRW